MERESGQEGERPWQVEFHRTASPRGSHGWATQGPAPGLTSPASETPEDPGASTGLLPSPPARRDVSPGLTPATWNLSFVFSSAQRLPQGAGESLQVSDTGPDWLSGDALHPLRSSQSHHQSQAALKTNEIRTRSLYPALLASAPWWLRQS